MAVADVLKMIEENDVKFVDLRFTDTRGKEQHVTIPAHVLTEDAEEWFEHGHAFDGSSIAGWKGIQASDMLLMADPATANIDPFFESSVLSRGLIAEHQGELWVASPLKKQRFRLRDGLCMEDESHSVAHYEARVKDGVVQLRG